MTADESTRSVELPETLVQRVEDRLPRTEWEEPKEYIAFVLEEVLAAVETESELSEDFESVDEDEVKDRLESLGYLNE